MFYFETTLSQELAIDWVVVVMETPIIYCVHICKCMHMYVHVVMINYS